MLRSFLVLGIAIAAVSCAWRTGHAAELPESARKGVPDYWICSKCHSLRPGIHLSGPSLAGLWGKKVASAEGFSRYTTGLKQAGFVWDEDALNAWLANPKALVPGTAMIFQGIEDAETRAGLIAFLRIAMAAGGATKLVNAGFIPEEMASGQIPEQLRSVGPDKRITAIRHCRDIYYISTEAAAEFPYWEYGVRLKTDTSDRGPRPGQPVLVQSGSVGDRVSVVFSSLAEINQIISENCLPR